MKNDESTASTEIEVEDLCCADCAIVIEKALTSDTAIKELKILPTSEKLLLTYDTNRLTRDEIVRRIQTLGYQVRDARHYAGETKRSISKMVSFAFVASVAVLVILEILLEHLQLFKITQIPIPILVVATLVGGFSIFREAFEGVRHRQITADLLMAIAIISALSIQEYSASVLIVFFMSIAHFLESFTVRKSRQAIDELVRLVPKTARVKRDGSEVEIQIDELKVGEVIIVRPGERIPADGVVVRGRSSVDQSPITGESIPVEKQEGDNVFAGTINKLGMMQLSVTRVGRDTTLGRIVSLVEEAEAAKAPIQRFADRYSSYYLPVVLLASFITFVLTRVPLYSIAVLVVACPCAIALATPLAVVASAGSSAKRGVLIKGGLFLERLAKVDTIVVDKTGTLTLGKPLITDVIPFSGVGESELIRLAASAESYSEHPLASAVLDHAKSNGITLEEPELFEARAGKGITCILRKRKLVVGNFELVNSADVDFDRDAVIRNLQELEQRGKTVLLVAWDRKLLGMIAVADILRDEVSNAFVELKRMKFENIVLLTGDNERVAAHIAGRLGITTFRANLLPEDKIAEIRKLQQEGHVVAMIGDGVNDAPALTQADVGIAMGATGSDVALEAAHLVLMRDDWRQIPMAVKIAKRTFRTIKQNVAFGVLFNIVGVILASVGVLTPILAAVAQSLPDVVVFLNSSRLLRPR